MLNVRPGLFAVLSLPMLFLCGCDPTLVVAARKNDTRRIQELIDRGANPNDGGVWGISPLYYAADYSSIEFIRTLLDNGADPNLGVEGKGGACLTPLHRAAEIGRADVVRLLIAKGASLDKVTPEGNTALMLARQKGHTEVIQILTAAEASSKRVQASPSETAHESPPPPVSDVDEPPKRAAPPRDDAYAVVIGIRKYQLGLPEADFSDSDARVMRSYLTGTMGFQDANVAVLLNEQATKSSMEKYFEAWLPNRAGKGSEVFVYYSGHGAPNPKTGDAFLVPYDGDPSYIDVTGYPLRKFYSTLAKLPAKVTLVLDSCFSGAGGRSLLAKGARPLVTVSAQAEVPQELTVLSAARGDQISHSYHEKGHGLFTYFLLKGIKDAGGMSDARAIFDYAAPKVANTARREYNADQSPQYSGRP